MPQGNTGKTIERDFALLSESLTGSMALLERRYTKGEVAKEDYENARDAISTCLDAVFLCNAIGKKIWEIDDFCTENLGGIIGLGRRSAFGGCLAKKNEIQKLFAPVSRAFAENARQWHGSEAKAALPAKGKKAGTGIKAFSKFRAEFGEMHSGLIEMEHALKKIVEADAFDKVKQAGILNELEKTLGKVEAREKEDRATLELADEFVIDVPEKIAKERHPAPKREAKGRKRKQLD
ncbi:Uncharacterised protein [uncultured archaeon]|nr:Uncharacterised protein [uncultured archaeon]